MCTFSLMYSIIDPKEWLDESQISIMFLSTYEECCNIFYQNDDECIKYDKGCEIIDHNNFLPGGEMSNCDTKWLLIQYGMAALMQKMIIHLTTIPRIVYCNQHSSLIRRMNVVQHIIKVVVDHVKFVMHVLIPRHLLRLLIHQQIDQHFHLTNVNGILQLLAIL